MLRNSKTSNKHICSTSAHPQYCETHNIEYYRSTCGCRHGCPGCDLNNLSLRAELLVEDLRKQANRADLSEALAAGVVFQARVESAALKFEGVAI